MGNLGKILKMVKDGQTAQRVILVNESLEPFVILSLENYEQLLQGVTNSDVSEQELLNRINKDIALLNEIQKQEEGKSIVNESKKYTDPEEENNDFSKEVSYEDIGPLTDKIWSDSEEKVDSLAENESEDQFYTEPV